MIPHLLLNQISHFNSICRDFKEVDEKLLAPTLKALSPIANISVESQVLYHTPKSSYSYWDAEQESHVFSNIYILTRIKLVLMILKQEL